MNMLVSAQNAHLQTSDWLRELLNADMLLLENLNVLLE